MLSNLGPPDELVKVSRRMGVWCSERAGEPRVWHGSAGPSKRSWREPAPVGSAILESATEFRPEPRPPGRASAGRTRAYGSTQTTPGRSGPWAAREHETSAAHAGAGRHWPIRPSARAACSPTWPLRSASARAKRAPPAHHWRAAGSGPGLGCVRRAAAHTRPPGRWPPVRYRRAPQSHHPPGARPGAAHSGPAIARPSG